MFTKQKRGPKFSLLLISALLFLTTLSGSLAVFMGTANAIPVGGTWIDQIHISFGGQLYTDTQLDDTWVFFDNANSSGSACNNFIHNFDGGETKPTDGTILKNPSGAEYVARKKDPATGSCNTISTAHISLAEPRNAHADFLWKDSTTIQAVTSDVFAKNSSDGLFYEQGGDRCKDTMAVSVNTGSLIIRTGGDSTSYGDHNLWINQYIDSSKAKNVDNCTVYPAFDVAISNYNNGRAKAAGSSGVATGGGTSAATASSCESNGGALSWVICPVIELLDNAITGLDSQIQAQLQTPDPEKVRDAKGNGNINQLKETWGRLRNIALIVLVPIMLIMVIGTAIGVSGLDAYTVKRAMPRLLIAVIFISLSWYITSFLVNLTNVVGAGIFGLMTTPFGIANKTLGSLITGPVGGTSSYLAVGGLFVAGVVGALSLGIIASLAFTAAVALFLGFIVLVIRQVLIFVLILLAPLAILAWIFPNNNKLWNLWWDTFSKLLMMYPLVIMLIAAGRIGASVIPLQQGSNSPFTQALVIVAYITPYFLIPATFKFAGGVFANLSGIVNDRGRGIFDRNKKYRQEARARGWQEFKAGDGRGALRRTGIVRRAGLGVGAGWSGHYGFGERGRQKIGGNVQTSGDQYLKDHANAAKVFVAQDDTAALMGLSGGTVAGAKVARDQLRDQWIASGVDVATATNRSNRAYESAMALGVSTSAAAGALSIMSQNKSRAIAAGNYEIVQDGINRLSRGNAQLAQDLSYNYQYNSRGAGRIDLGGDWTSAAVAAAPTPELRRRAVFMDGVKRTGTIDLVKGYTASTDQAIQTIQADFASGDVTRMLDAAALTAEMQGNLTQASGENRDRISAMLSDLGVDTSGPPEAIEAQLLARVNAGGAAIQLGELQNYVRNWSRTVPPGTPGGPGTPPTAPPPPAPPPSDRRLKTDIKFLTLSDNGIKLYSFRYFWSNQKYVGVMAQDLLTTHPEALLKDKYGYYKVNYEALGLRMMTLEEWQELHSSKKLGLSAK